MLKTKVEILEKVRPKLVDLEVQRKELSEAHQRDVTKVLTAIGVGLVLVIVCAAVITNFSFVLVMGITIAMVAGGFYYLNTKRKPDERDYNQSLGHILVKTLGSDWTYGAKQFLPPRQIDQTGLFGNYTKITGDNLVHGRHGETDFSFSYLDLLREGGNGGHTVFSGLILVADFPKKMKGKTLVFPDIAQRTLGTWLGKKVQEFGRKGLDLVYMEDPEFEKAFAVYGSNQIEARYILTPNMMNNLLVLHKNYEGQLSFAFTNGKVCVAIKNVEPFQANLSDKINPQRTFNRFYQRIELVTHIIDTLQLNTRIWAKD